MTELEIDERLLPLARYVEQAIPFHRHLGLTVQRLVRGACALRVPWQEHLIGDPIGPIVHGGVAPALANTAGGLACFTHVDSPDRLIRAKELRMDYLRPGHAHDILCEAHVESVDGDLIRAVMTVSAVAAPDQRAAPSMITLAKGEGIYKVLRPRGARQ